MSTPSSPVHLFVYGTLRRSHQNPMHALLGAATLVGPGTLPGRLYDIGNYPGAVADPAADTLIYGEVYALGDPSATLDRLDAYEACTEADASPHEYVRTVTTVTLADGRSVPAWVYLYHRAVDGLPLVSSGNWFGR